MASQTYSTLIVLKFYSWSDLRLNRELILGFGDFRVLVIWWYNSCMNSNTNGRFFAYGDKKMDNIGYGMQWLNYLKFIEIKIRRNKEENCADQW